MVPEISDRIVEIDRAMRWGYAHKLGPFELWDALGFEDVCKRLEAEKREIPENIEKMRRAGAKSLYKSRTPTESRHRIFRSRARRNIKSWKSGRASWFWPI